MIFDDIEKVDKLMRALARAAERVPETGTELHNRCAGMGPRLTTLAPHPKRRARVRPPPPVDELWKTCREAWTSVYVTAAGKVHFCAGGPYIGDLHTDGVFDVFNSAPAKRQRALFSRRMYPECSSGACKSGFLNGR